MPIRKNILDSEATLERLLRLAHPSSNVHSWSQVTWPQSVTALARFAFRQKLKREPVLKEKADAGTSLWLAFNPLVTEWIRSASRSDIYPAILIWAFYIYPLSETGGERPGRDNINTFLNRSDIQKLAIDMASFESQRELIKKALKEYSSRDRWFMNTEKNRGISQLFRRVDACYQELVSKYNQSLPCLPDRYYERTVLLEQLTKEIEKKTSDLFFVTGPAGAGKTTLVASWAHQQAAQLNFPDGIHWFSDLDFSMFERRFPAALGAASLTGSLSGLQTKQMLLIVDNPVDEKIIDWLVSQKRLSTLVIVITRFESWVNQRALPARILRVAELKPPERQPFLKQYVVRYPVEDSNLEIINQVGDLVGWLPMAMAILTRSADTTSWSDVLAGLKAKWVQVYLGDPDALDQPFRTALDVTFEQLDDETRRAWLNITCMGLVSSFDRTAVEFALACDAQQAQQYLERLAGASLLEKANDTRYRLHWTIWQYAKNKQSALKFDCPELDYQQYGGLLYKPSVWWKPTVPGDGSPWWEAFTDRKLWWYPDTIVGHQNWWDRIRMRQAKLVQNYLLKNTRLLPFEQLATLKTLAQRSDQLMGKTHNIWLFVVIMAVAALWGWIGLTLSLSLWAIVLLSAPITLLCALLFEYSFWIHQINYYRFIRLVFKQPGANDASQ